jgi:hypothetical protein
MQFSQRRYKFPAYLKDVTRMGRVYQLKLGPESIVIPSLSIRDIVRGYATLMCADWARDGWSCSLMMRFHAQMFLGEVGISQKYVKLMLEIAEQYPKLYHPKLEDDYDWEANALPPYYLNE